MTKIQNRKPILKSKSFYFCLAILSCLFYLLPQICNRIAGLFIFQEYLHLDAPRLSVGLKKAMVWPLSKGLSLAQLNIVAILWFALFVFIGLAIWRFLKPFRKIIIIAVGLLFIGLFIVPQSLTWLESNQPSKSQGHVANGRIAHAKRFPMRGPNHTSYSFLAYLAGRTYVHGTLRDVVLQSYKICTETCPERTFVIGEIGHASGGEFLPHRTHRNGLSVDFMSPLLREGKPKNSHHILNLWGYSLEFDDDGKKENVTIDFEALAQHLWALELAAKQRGMIIQKVIFDPILRKKLKATTCWKKISHLPFTKNRVAWRHDDHYHVDFGFPSNGRD